MNKLEVLSFLQNKTNSHQPMTLTLLKEKQTKYPIFKISNKLTLIRFSYNQVKTIGNKATQANTSSSIMELADTILFPMLFL